MIDPASAPAQSSITASAVGTMAITFAIGTAAGLTSVFLPRMMLLLSVDTEPAPGRYITVFQSDFVWLGLAFALAIGIICAILEFGTPREPRAIFMTALGIPALVSGVLNTTSATNKLQTAEQEKVAILRTVSDQAGISQERVQTLQPLGGSPSGGSEGARPSSALDLVFVFAEPAFAQSASSVAQQPARFDPGIQVQRPSYLLILKRAASQEEAQRYAKELQKSVPTAQAVRTDQGFLVVDSLTPRREAEALFDAIQLKTKKKLDPSLLQVPK